MSSPNTDELKAAFEELKSAQARLSRLQGQAEALHGEHTRIFSRLAEVQAFLELAPSAELCLQDISAELFGGLADELAANLTHAVREVLGQERTVLVNRDTLKGKLSFDLSIEQDGHVEDIMRGQGGSVANVLSVSLRLIGLTLLDPAKHRPFLVLDEADCWLRPDLVPRFAKLISGIAHRLGLQVLYISHHPVEHFAGAADLILALEPGKNGTTVTVLKRPETDVDPAEES